VAAGFLPSAVKSHPLEFAVQDMTTVGSLMGVSVVQRSRNGRTPGGGPGHRRNVEHGQVVVPSPPERLSPPVAYYSLPAVLTENILLGQALGSYVSAF